MSKRWQISRRTFLKGVGASLALPYLDIMGARQSRCRQPTHAASLHLPAQWRVSQGLGCCWNRDGFSVFANSRAAKEPEKRAIDPF